MKLYKMSVPGWTVEVADEAEAAEKLWPHICKSCRDGTIWTGEDGEEVDRDPPVTESDLYGMLRTPCGCEYGVEEC